MDPSAAPPARLHGERVRGSRSHRQPRVRDLRPAILVQVAAPGRRQQRALLRHLHRHHRGLGARGRLMRCDGLSRWMTAADDGSHPVTDGSEEGRGVRGRPS